MIKFRVLIVDDYEPFRRVVRLILEVTDDLQIVGEASDGLEAVQKAQELRPDLILLDIDLPRLNGIQAARRLRDLVPRPKILFLSVESSSDVVREAFNVGGVGYVQKLHVQSELLPAIEAVCQGNQFIGADLTDEIKENTTIPEPRHPHEVLIYSEEAVLVQCFTDFIIDALRTNKPVIAAPTQSHLEIILQRVRAEGVDVDASIRMGSFITLNASEKLSALMLNDLPDRSRWMNAMSSLVQAVRSKGSHFRIAMCGECSALLLEQGNLQAAVRLEQLCDDLADTHQFDVLCAYPSSSFLEKGERFLEEIRSQHSAVHSR